MVGTEKEDETIITHKTLRALTPVRGLHSLRDTISDVQL